MQVNFYKTFIKNYAENPITKYLMDDFMNR